MQGVAIDGPADMRTIFQHVVPSTNILVYKVRGLDTGTIRKIACPLKITVISFVSSTNLQIINGEI